MMRANRRVWIGAGLAMAIGGGALVPFPASSLGDEISQAAETRLGLRLQAGSTTVSLTRGLTLRDVTAGVSTGGLDLTARIERVVASHALSVRAPRRIEAIRILRPTVTVIVGPPSSSVQSTMRHRDPPPGATTGVAPDTEPDDGASAALIFSGPEGLRVSVMLADVDVRSPETNAVPFQALGTDLELETVTYDESAPTLIRGLSGQGTMNSRELWIGPVVVVDAASPVTMAGGRILLSSLTFWCDGRHLRLRDVDLDFTTDPFSLGTPGTVSERRRADADTPLAWAPAGSLTDLDRLCGR